MTIEMVKVRAKIAIGDLVAGTPPTQINHILSFNVDRVRGQIGTFSASIKVLGSQLSGDIVGDDIVISAGEDSAEGAGDVIFVGMVKSVTITPNRDDPQFVIMNLNGADALSRLEGRKFTRRCRSSKGPWVSITGVTRRGLKSGKLAYVEQEPTLTLSSGDVQKKDNVTSTRVIPYPEKEIDRLPEGPQKLQPVPEIQFVEGGV